MSTSHQVFSASIGYLKQYLHRADTIYCTMCDCGVKVTAEIEFREMEEENERQLKQKASKAARKQSGKASGKDTKKASSKSSTKKKGISNADFVLAVLEITVM